MKRSHRILCAALSALTAAAIIPLHAAASGGVTSASAAIAPSAAEAAIETTASAENALDLDCIGAILIEASTGEVLYESNADTALPPASVTKIMTLLLCMEEIDSGRMKLEDTVSVSEYAASMGGSQVFLEPGEQMTVDEMLKCVTVASANDAAVALAEAVAGSEEAFVAKMNDRAAELGMTGAHFENVTGLDDDTVSHVLSARDIAIMSAELLKHEKILDYTGIWMDSIRGGSFTLTNTNRLIRFYSGATGLKTGSTSKAHFCISATAMRDGMHLIAVVMGSPTRDVRNECAKKLLDYGFANYSLYTYPGGEIADCPAVEVKGGTENTVTVTSDGFSSLLGRGEAANVRTEIILPESVPAPIDEGETLGEVVFFSGDREIGRAAVRSTSSSDRIGFFGLLREIFSAMLLK